MNTQEMDEYGSLDPIAEGAPPPEPPRRRTTRRWLVTGGLALALAAAVGVGTLIGPSIAPSYAAASNLFAFTQSTAAPGYGEPHGPRGGREHGDHLTITSVSAQAITGKRADGTSVTVSTTSSTVYMRAGKSVDRSTLVAGTVIDAEGANSTNGSITATRVDVVLPMYDGTVTAVNGSDITVQDDENTSASLTIHTTGSTTFTRAGVASSLAAMAKGTKIRAVGSLNADKSLTADAVDVMLPQAGGQVTQISGSTITVQDRRGTQTIHVSAATTYTTVTPGSATAAPTTAPATSSDLKVGSEIHVTGTQNSDGSFNAESVSILPAGADGFGGPHGGAPDGAPGGAAGSAQQ